MKNDKKQKVKKTVETIVSGVLASSILASSCSVPHVDDNLYDEYIPERDVGEELLPVSIRLKPEDAKYIKALQALSQDILHNPSIAKEVTVNPNILARYGYDGAINLEDSVIKIILALGNDEISQAIKDKDINKFMALCKQYGLLSDKIQSDLLSDEFYQEQMEKIKRFAKTRAVSEQDDDLQYDIFLVAGALVVVVVGVVVVTGVGAVWNVGAAWNNYVTVNRVANTKADMYQKDVSVIDVIPMTLADGYHLISEYYEDTVQAGIDFIREMYPEILEVYTEDELRQLLYVNLQENANK